MILGGLKNPVRGSQRVRPAVLSKLPYVDRLFRNVGYGREAESLLLMVTPRVIINAEEEERQTGVITEFADPGCGPHRTVVRIMMLKRTSGRRDVPSPALFFWRSNQRLGIVWRHRRVDGG